MSNVYSFEQYRARLRLHRYFERQRARADFDPIDTATRAARGLDLIRTWCARFRAREHADSRPSHGSAP